VTTIDVEGDRQPSVVRFMDFVDHVDLKPVHTIHPVHHLDAENNFSSFFEVPNPGVGAEKGVGARGMFDSVTWLSGFGRSGLLVGLSLNPR
jgi:hypothetical protein